MTLRRFLVAFPLLLLVGAAVAMAVLLVPRENPQPLPASLIPFDSEAGQALLAEAEATADLDDLSASFRPQRLTSFCGVASSVAVLNALGQTVTQRGFFDGRTGQVRSRWRVVFGGMPLDALGGLLVARGASVEVRHADGLGAAEFRAALRRNLSTEGDYLIVNYLREVLGQGASGHISPLAAYDAESDRVLVLDTAAHRFPWTWVPLPDLLAAMATTDGESGLPRGYVEVRAGP
ncbi:phytochelatin synthase family protein [Rhodobacter sp. NSM]|uniref:phytochelatin synthase family protein n=1 Tax=Rhodobacter sp. NSM TaxID=3457501 RepID=UPI003FD31F07